MYLQGEYHLVSPCHYLDVRIKQKDSSSPLRLLLPQVRSEKRDLPPPVTTAVLYRSVVRWAEGWARGAVIK